MKKSIKELRMGLTDTHKFIPSATTSPGFTDGNTDSYFSRYSNNRKLTGFDIEEYSDDDDEDILRDADNYQDIVNTKGTPRDNH